MASAEFCMKVCIISQDIVDELRDACNACASELENQGTGLAAGRARRATARLEKIEKDWLRRQLSEAREDETEADDTGEPETPE